MTAAALYRGMIFAAALLFLPSISYSLIGVKEGESPKLFTLDNLQGSSVSISSYVGKRPVILVFWELPMSKAFLDYSLDELRFLNDLYGKHHEKTGIEIFAVYTPEEEKEITPAEIDQVKNLIKVNNIKFPVLLDRGFTIFREYGVIALPSTVMINKTGKIEFIYPSFPISARPLFTEKIEVLAGLANRAVKVEQEKTKGPDSHSVRLYNYSLQMFRKGLLEQAMSPLKKSLEMDPALTRAHNLMGILLWKSGDFRGAQEEFRLAMKEDDHNAPSHFNFAMLLYQSEDFIEAEKYFKKVISIDGSRAEAFYMLGLLYKETGREDDAVQYLTTALENFEKRNKAYASEVYAPYAFQRISTLYTLSELYRRRGDENKALDLLQSAAEIALGIDVGGSNDFLHRTRDLMIYE